MRAGSGLAPLNPLAPLFSLQAAPNASFRVGWDQSTWIANRNGRDAHGIALSAILRDGAISRDRANVIATEVLRISAEQLYSLKNSSAEF